MSYHLTKSLWGCKPPGSSDDRIVYWENKAASFTASGNTHIMTPLPGTVYGPDDWEEANLTAWLSDDAPEEYRKQRPTGPESTDSE